MSSELSVKSRAVLEWIGVSPDRPLFVFVLFLFLHIDDEPLSTTRHPRLRVQVSGLIRMLPTMSARNASGGGRPRGPL